MKKIIAIVIFACFVFVGTAGAVMLSLETDSTVLEPSSIFDVDLVVSGLGNGVAPSVGDFDIDILYDPGVMTFVDYELGPYLGNVGSFEAIDSSLGDLGDRVDLAEISLLLPVELDVLQSDSFSLASVTFNYLGLGSSIISIDDSSDLLTYKVGDAFGEQIIVTSLGDPLKISPVPEPTTIVLLGTGLIGLAGLGRKKLFMKS